MKMGQLVGRAMAPNFTGPSSWWGVARFGWATTYQLCSSPSLSRRCDLSATSPLDVCGDRLVEEAMLDALVWSARHAVCEEGDARRGVVVVALEGVVERGRDESAEDVQRVAVAELQRLNAAQMAAMGWLFDIGESSKGSSHGLPALQAWGWVGAKDRRHSTSVGGWARRGR